ncbi:MAG: hypothetical protein HC824_17475 [Synechococcales cyanobacterium RM1_1_8]|nr:hypothetical protein [Synechococcales cyanobacterium RM1_1_8]
MRRSILKEGQSYTFSEYFKLAVDPEDLLREFGFGLGKAQLALTSFAGEMDWRSLQSQIEENLTYVDLTSETARREILVAPLLLRICRIAQAKLKIEYPIQVSDRLKGNLDYYLQSQQGDKANVLVIEAKQADLTRGFTQLAVELIALDQWTESEAPVLWGAVTTGDIWKFGILDRHQKCITQDLNLYRVPADLEALMQILIAVLAGRAAIGAAS